MATKVCISLHQLHLPAKKGLILENTCNIVLCVSGSELLLTGTTFEPSKKRRGGAVRGANNGKLLPGEKKRLKKEKMNAKRAARSAAHGLDLEAVNAELIQFVAADGDMKVCHVHN